eukprot:15309120-Alexandrium_andersonii.AAC.1
MHMAIGLFSLSTAGPAGQKVGGPTNCWSTWPGLRRHWWEEGAVELQQGRPENQSLARKGAPNR